jgi:hypothetical protein
MKTDEQCDIKNCAHYINKSKTGFYKSKFLISIIVCTVVTIGLFCLFSKNYNDSQQEIIRMHTEFCQETENYLKSLSSKNDSLKLIHESVVYKINERNDAMSAMLEMQYNKIQNDFSLLSLWAGLLTIVFLIFSIYSIFKVDEMQKQGREYLSQIGDISEKAKNTSHEIELLYEKKVKDLNKQTNEELSKLKNETNKILSEIEKNISNLNAQFQDLVSSKTNEFNNTAEATINKIKSSAEENKNLLSGLIKLLTSGNKE